MKLVNNFFIIMSRLWFIVLTAVTASKFVSGDSQWELAVAVTDQIDLITRTGEVIDRCSVPNGKVTALAYNPMAEELYFTNMNDDNFSIFQLNLFNHTDECSYIPLVTKQDGDIKSLTIDTMDRTLYWTVGNHIKYLKWDNANGRSAGIVLHSLVNYKPFGLAVDVCNRMLYWTSQMNGPKKMSAIQKSKLNGDNKTDVNINNNSAYGIFIDNLKDRVYWSEEEEGSHMYIKSLPLHKSGLENQEIHMDNGNGHRPTSLTKLDWELFWTDEPSMQFYTNEKDNSERVLRPRMYIKSNPQSEVHCIISMKKESYIDPNNCQRNPVTEKNQADENKTENSKPISGEMQFVERNVKSCSDGSKSETTGNNSCEEKHSVTFNDLCYNYCLNDGLCDIISDKPNCRCKPSWGGERCETNLCLGYCHNGGMCYIENHTLKCMCGDSYKGDRCEQHAVSTEHYVCLAHCSLIHAGYDRESAIEILSSQEIPDKVKRSSCRCEDYIKNFINKAANDDSISMNSTGVKGLPIASSNNNSSDISECAMDSWITLIIFILSILCLVLMAIAAVLTNKVLTLRKRPRIKKRIVVSKNVRPLTSRPQATDHCEIPIENCCNMSICETPCFEPELRKPSATEKSKKEEKKSLLTAIDLPPDDLY